MEEKVKITLKKRNKKTVEFNGVKVKVIPFISAENYDIILDDIKKNIFYNSKIENKCHMIDLRLYKDVLELCTNIDVEHINIEDLFREELSWFLNEHIENLGYVADYIKEEYKNYVMENCFGILGNKMPTTEDMEKSVENISKMIENLPQDKLELIGKSIVWNNSPALGKAVAPAEHIKTNEIMAEA